MNPASGGKKRLQNVQMGAESAIKMEKWWRKTPSNKQSDGRKCHYFSNLVELQPHISNCGGALTTTYHIQGAGAPAKTKNYVNADGVYIFREKVRPFPHLAKPVNTILRKDEKSNDTDKKRLVRYSIKRIRKGRNTWQMESEDTSLTGKIIRYR